VATVELKQAAGLAYRESVPETDSGRDPVLCVHGFPQSSYVFRHLLPALADSGRRALAVDLHGFGDSEPDRPGTWEHHIESLQAFHQELGLERVVLVVHDWGGLIGLRWACDHPEVISGLVISNTGFFPDAEWHALAKALQTEGQGETLIDSFSREGVEAALSGLGTKFDSEALDEYWKAFTTEDRRHSLLELYRSGDLSKLEPYRGRLADLGVPTLILWGGGDQEYTPVESARAFEEMIPEAKLVVVEDAGHFVFEAEPQRCNREVLGFLEAAGV
jgi:haloalkane dehalogenase